MCLQRWGEILFNNELCEPIVHITGIVHFLSKQIYSLFNAYGDRKYSNAKICPNDDNRNKNVEKVTRLYENVPTYKLIE